MEAVSLEDVKLAGVGTLEESLLIVELDASLGSSDVDAKLGEAFEWVRGEDRPLAAISE